MTIGVFGISRFDLARRFVMAVAKKAPAKKAAAKKVVKKAVKKAAKKK